jgi:hypothetical protein
MYESRVPTGRTVSVEAKRNLVERSRPRPRVPRATEGAVDVSLHFSLRKRGCRRRLTLPGENGDRGGRHLFRGLEEQFAAGGDGLAGHQSAQVFGAACGER